jgi:hypothetical protein
LDAIKSFLKKKNEFDGPKYVCLIVGINESVNKTRRIQCDVLEGVILKQRIQTVCTKEKVSTRTMILYTGFLCNQIVIFALKSILNSSNLMGILNETFHF